MVRRRTICGACAGAQDALSATYQGSGGKVQTIQGREGKPAKIKDEAEVTEIGAMEMVKGGEIVHDDVTIPQITVNQEKFNTVNLQQEIAKGMQQIIEAKGKNEVADTMDTIKR